MLQKKFCSSGKNKFKNNVFDSREWSAPCMVDPEEIKSSVSSFCLEGRTIKHLKFTGMDYCHSRDCIEDIAYRQLKQYDEDIRQQRSEYDNIAPETSYGRYAELDEPLLIWFEDNDVFEIDTPQEPEFRFSMNCISWYSDEGCNNRNVDADVLFSSCIGKTIQTVEVRTCQTDRDPMLSDYFDDEHSGKELVSDIILWFTDRSSLRIGPHNDYMRVISCDPDNCLEEISFQELKSGVFNWEDLHIDHATGYISESGHLYFNTAGRQHAGSLYTGITCGKSKAFVCSDDCVLLRWAIISYLKRQPETYEEISFGCEQWNRLLCDAEKLIGYGSFDDMYDDLVSRDITFGNGKNAMVWYLNGMGAEVWRRIDIHKRILADIRKWTGEMLPDDGTITVCGND